MKIIVPADTLKEIATPSPGVSVFEACGMPPPIPSWHMRAEIKQWCIENLETSVVELHNHCVHSPQRDHSERMYATFATLTFGSLEDATLFKLRWFG